MKLYPHGMYGLLLLWSLGLLVGGGWFYQSQERRMRQAVEDHLHAVGDLKVQQLVHWRNERLGDAALVYGTPYATRRARDVIAAPGSQTTREMFTGWLDPLMASEPYERAVLVDEQLQVRLVHPPRAPRELCAEAQDAAAQALRTRQVVVADLHRAADGEVHMSLVVPMVVRHAGDVPAAGLPPSATDRSVAALVLEVNAKQRLFPLLRAWPTPSRTAETLLVRRDGDAALFLSESRHQPGLPLQLRVPLTDTDMPAVMAVSGKTGVVYGQDYRGADVCAVITAVPKSPWRLVAKIDRAEAFVAGRTRSLLLLAAMVGFAALGVAVVIALALRKGRADYRALYEAESSRRQSEAMYHSLVDQLPQAVFRKDDAGRFTFANPRFCELVGRSVQDLLGKTDADLFPAELAEKYRQDDRRVMDSGEVWTDTERQMTPDAAADRWVEVVKWPLRDADGQVIGIQGTFWDVTERERAQEVLRASEARLNESQRIAHLGSWESQLVSLEDLSQNRLTWSDETFRIFGYEPGAVEVTREVFSRGVHPEDLPRVWAAVEAAVREHLPYQVEHRVVRPDGSERLVVEHAEVLCDPVAGRPLKLHGTVQDITAEKHAAAERERLLAAIEQAGEAIFITDSAGRIQYVNPAFEAITGYPRDEILLQNPRFLKSGKHDESLYREMWETISGGRTWKGRLINRRKDGAHYTQEATISPVLDGAGRIVNYVAISRDITPHLRVSEEKDRLEEQLRQTHKMEAIGRLAGGVAHDFNNMLNIILGYGEMALEQLRAGDPLRENLQEIVEAGRRSAALTRQLLAFSRKQTLQPKVFDLNAVILNLQKMLRRLIGEDIELNLPGAREPAPVLADPGQIEQAIMNLVVNARDAMPHGGRLTIETANVTLDDEFARTHLGVTPGRYVKLAVADTGCGMDQEVLANLFVPFFTTKDKGRGTGLGLATTHGIVKQSGGHIWVDSELGRGTTFRIYLPQVEMQPETAPQQQQHVPWRGGGRQILVVEDETALRGLVARVLSGLDFRVTTAADGGEALLLVEERGVQPDLLITDVIMPGISGAVLAERLRQRWPELKILFMSGYTDNAMAQFDQVDPGAPFLQKPFNIRDLSLKVRELLGPAQGE